MNSNRAKPFFEARTDLQAACSRAHPIIRRQVEAHRHSFIWQMDRGLKNDLFGVPLEQAESATLTADQIRRITRENGKSYSQACLSITPKILSLSASIQALADGKMTLQEELNCFRSVVERLAVLEIAYQKVSCSVNPSEITSFNDLIEVREIIMSLIGTRFNWSELQLAEFSEMPADTRYTHNPDDTRMSLSATSILGQVDKLQKQGKYKGIRPFYNFCCEFVHPNIGDIFSTTAEKKVLRTDGGQLAYKTKLDEDPLRHPEINGELFVMFAGAYAFAENLIDEAARVSTDFGNLLKSMNTINRRCAHRVVKRQSQTFSKGDYCPCGSGRRIRACALG